MQKMFLVNKAPSAASLIAWEIVRSFVKFVIFSRHADIPCTIVTDSCYHENDVASGKSLNNIDEL
jgi:hypothetical protein